MVCVLDVVLSDPSDCDGLVFLNLYLFVAL